MRKGPAYDMWNIYIYPVSFVTQMFRSGQPSHGGDRTIFDVTTSILPKETFGSVASLLAATLYQRIPDMSGKSYQLRYMLHMQVLLECCYI